jgi:hypothetical protein
MVTMFFIYEIGRLLHEKILNGKADLVSMWCTCTPVWEATASSSRTVCRLVTRANTSLKSIP